MDRFSRFVSFDFFILFSLMKRKVDYGHQRKSLVASIPNYCRARKEETESKLGVDDAVMLFIPVKVIVSKIAIIGGVEYYAVVDGRLAVFWIKEEKGKLIGSQNLESTLLSKQCFCTPVVACVNAIVVLIVVHRFTCGCSMSLLLWMCSYAGPSGKVSEITELFSELRKKLSDQGNPHCVLPGEADLVLDFLELELEVVLGFFEVYMLGFQLTGVKVLRILIQKPFLFKFLKVNLKASHVNYYNWVESDEGSLDVNGGQMTILSLSNKTRVGFRVRVEFWDNDGIVVWFPITDFVNTEF